MSDAQTTGYAVLEYVAPHWSLGDSFQVALDFEDHADMVRHLEPLGLGMLAAPRVYVESVELAGVSLTVDVYGTLVTLKLHGPDRYEHLTAADFDNARKVDDLLRAAGLEARRGEVMTDDRGSPPNPPPARLPRPAEVVYHLVFVTGQTETGFACKVERKTLTSGVNLAPLTIFLVPETRHIDHVSQRPCEAKVTVGNRLLVRLTLGRGPDGGFATVAETAEHVVPDAAGIEAAERLAAPYSRAGMELHLGDAAAIACMALFARAMDPDWDLAAYLTRELLSKSHAYTGRWVGSVAFEPLVAEMLFLLAWLELPCDFRAHALVRAAEARRLAGEDVNALVHELTLRMVDEANRALGKRGDTRRYRPARAFGEDVWLALEAATYDGLVREGLLLAR